MLLAIVIRIKISHLIHHKSFCRMGCKGYARLDLSFDSRGWRIHLWATFGGAFEFGSPLDSCDIISIQINFERCSLWIWTHWLSSGYWIYLVKVISFINPTMLSNKISCLYHYDLMTEKTQNKIYPEILTVLHYGLLLFITNELFNQFEVKCSFH